MTPAFWSDPCQIDRNKKDQLSSLSSILIWTQRDQLEMITLDQLVPANHLVRKIEGAIDFTFIYDLVKEMYSEIGRPRVRNSSLVE